MLFRRNIEPRCSYCKYGTRIGFGEVACTKRGIMSDYGRCSAFRYEPTKREPEFARNLRAPSMTETDFMI